jgi:hypothetical protein
LHSQGDRSHRRPVQRSRWRETAPAKDVGPPRIGAVPPAPATDPKEHDARRTAPQAHPDRDRSEPFAVPSPGDVVCLAPNVIAVKHWNRLLGGLVYAVSPRVDWATLLRRSFDVDVLQCPRCHGRLRVIAVVTEREPVRRILACLGLPTDAPRVARARDPTDAAAGEREEDQLSLRLA